MLLKCLLFFVICLHSEVIKTSEAWRPFEVEISNISSKSFVNFIEINSSISTIGAMSLYVNLLQDLVNVYAKTTIVFESSSGNYDLVMINKTIDTCKFFADRKYEPIPQAFYQLLTKANNFPTSCPIRKKLIVVKDLLINPEDLPPVVPSRKAYIDLYVISKSAQKVKPLYWFKIYVHVNQLNKTKK